MLLDTYFEHIDDLFARVKSTQRDNIIAAGKLFAKTISTGNAIHIYDTGHIVNAELTNRGGGLIALKPLQWDLPIYNPVRSRDRSGFDTGVEGLMKYVLHASGVCPGDCIVIGSVSGKSLHVVDMALEAKNYGMSVVGLTSLDYSSSVKSGHSCGKRLFELSDVVLDNCAPVAEGMIKVEGIEAPFAAASGLSAAFLMWSACAVAVEELLKMGITPSILKSANFPGGEEYNEQLEKRYNETGF